MRFLLGFKANERNMKSTIPVLEHLFAAYKENPGSIHVINDVCHHNGEDPVRVSDELKNEKLIKDRHIYPGNVVACRITWQGIRQIDNQYVEEKIKETLHGLKKAGGSGNIMKFMHLSDTHYQIGLDVKDELVSQGLATFETGSFQDNTIIMTLPKKEEVVHE